ncbi:catechol 2,3-dioxygenase-like lactoylglutathione lyase family enzyme [Bacillus sp. V-88]|uniref:VOC family protein n=1 Tax=Rossellomorea vietnamensis TaxID=218284 RepID=UPI00055327EF|nr:VOC family protein [Rossellomorea vietnamensis]OXS57850.1 bleomycin resistance protein [Bacillus sp. DSM 27956]PRX75170.1 catechol 2,3-dioxygenase-like lactoylglutathione lyase family enzyme [Bacillus sp. V-88]SLK23863.1 Catechol 2,3-dioxygenase [Bacillus sp. V-88]
MKLTHTRLLVDNYRKCFLFYRDVLGFEVSWGDENSLYGQFKVGQTHLGIFERKQMPDALNSGNIIGREQGERFALIFEVASVEDTYEKLKEKVEFITRPMEKLEWGMKVAHFRDPEGTLLEIYENI